MATEVAEISAGQEGEVLLRVTFTLRDSPPARAGEIDRVQYFSAAPARWIAYFGRPVTYRFAVLTRNLVTVTADLAPGASGDVNVPAGYYIDREEGGMQFWEV